MSSQAAHDISVLNELLGVTQDSIAGYLEAAKDARTANHRQTFMQRAQDREHIVGHFKEQIRLLGGTPEAGGSLLAAAHRTFLNLKDSVSLTDHALLKEVERGEDFIKSKYEAALADPRLSPATRDIVSIAFGSVWSGHDAAAELIKGGGPHRPRAM